MEARDYQDKAIETAFDWIRRGNKRFVMEAPTGSGKSVVAARIITQAVRQGVTVLFAAHRIELLRQIREKLVEAELPEDSIRTHGKESEGPVGAPVHLGSVQTLLTRGPRNARLIVVDEAHRSASKTYLELFDLYPDATIIGLTATPERLDGRALDPPYNDILVIAKPSEMVARGYILEPSTWSADLNATPDLSNVPISMGDYSMKAAARALNQPHLVGNIVDHWVKYALGLPTICFASSVEHSKSIAQAFVDAGYRAEHIDGRTGDALRFDAKKRLVSGETQIVCNFGLWIEGIDIPEAKCAILARPTQSRTIYLQAIGRVARPSDGTRPVVLDHGCNWERFGSMAKDHVYSINGRPRKAKDDVPAAWICPACLFGNDRSVDVCAMCGTDKPKRAVKRKVRTVDGDLVEVTAGEDTPEVKRTYWDQLWFRAWNIGERPQWVIERYRKRFGEDPGGDWRPPARRKRQIDPREVWNEACRFRVIATKMKLSGDLQWAYIRQRIQSKFDLEFPVDMDPVAYAMSLNENEMAKRREEQARWYRKEGLPVPEPVRYGASTLLPLDGKSGEPAPAASDQRERSPDRSCEAITQLPAREEGIV